MISNEIRESLQQVCSLLNKHDVEYLIVGGVAVAYHGYQRASGIEMYKPNLKTDLDFWYNPTNENFQKLVKALTELGVESEALKKIIFDPMKTFLKIPHKSFHTDFLCQMHGLDPFKECIKRARREIIDGNQLSIIGYDDLIKNKMTIDRPIDKQDISELEKRRRKGPHLS